MAKQVGYMAIDQYGTTHHLPGVKHPRKALLAMFDRKHAAKMYADRKDGSSHHIGWIINGLWLRVYRVVDL